MHKCTNALALAPVSKDILLSLAWYMANRLATKSELTSSDIVSGDYIPIIDSDAIVSEQNKRVTIGTLDTHIRLDSVSETTTSVTVSGPINQTVKGNTNVVVGKDTQTYVLSDYVLLGTSAEVQYNDGIAIGHNAIDQGAYSMALGVSAGCIISSYNIALGYEAIADSAGGKECVIGNSDMVSLNFAGAVNMRANSVTTSGLLFDSGIYIGTNNQSNATVLIGTGSTTTADSVIIGNAHTAGGPSEVDIGYNNWASGFTNVITLGSMATCYQNNSLMTSGTSNAITIFGDGSATLYAANTYDRREAVRFDDSGVVDVKTIGISTVVDNGSGSYTINFGTAWTNTYYVTRITLETTSPMYAIVANQTTTDFDIQVYNAIGAPTAPASTSRINAVMYQVPLTDIF